MISGYILTQSDKFGTHCEQPFLFLTDLGMGVWFLSEKHCSSKLVDGSDFLQSVSEVALDPAEYTETEHQTFLGTNY